MTNQFERFVNLGYTRLLPIIPPDAKISEKSNLHKRVGTSQDGRGKTPGIKWRDGTWSGFDWIPYEADERDFARWAAMGAGVGIKTGDGLVAIDADTTDADHARIIRDTMEEMFGRTPVRVGQYPKALYPLRVAAPFNYARVEFGPERQEGAGRVYRVEILSDRKQFVAHGIHPKTQKPYEWHRPLVALDQLPIVSPQQLTAFLEALRQRLPNTDEVVREGALSTVSQASLAGKPELIRKAVESIPNTSEHFPSRESYRDFGYAIKAALPDDEAEAFGLFSDWCARWRDGENAPDVVAADWRRMKPPYRRGAHWLYELAEAYAPEKFSAADVWLENLDDPENPFAAASAAEQRANAVDNPDAQPPIKWLRPSEWQGVEPPQREWEVEGWIPRREVTLLYGDGGIGKTLAIHQYAAAAAAGVKWLGQETRQARVMCFFCEDSEDELLRRQIDINKALGVTFADIDDRLRIASRKYLDNLFVLWDRHTGAMKRQAVWQQLLDDARAFKAEVIIIDTIADVFGGSEIDRGQVNAFVKACLGRLGNEIGASVIALGHPSVSGKQSGSGTSGSTAWNNAVRSRLYLRYPKGIEKGNVRELEGMKLNYGPKGALLKLRWEAGAFVLMASSKPAARSGEAGERTGLPEGSIEAAARDAVTAAILRSRGVQMNLSPKSPYYAARVLMRREAELLEAITFEEVEEALRRLDREGAVIAEKVGSDGSRRAVYGLLYRDNMSEDAGVFS